MNMLPSDNFASTVLAAVPTADPRALAATLIAAVQQTAVWKWAEAAMLRDEVRGRHQERQAERAPAPELDYNDPDAGLYDDQDGDLYDPGLDDDDLY
jgi:hypothetical protein